MQVKSYRQSGTVAPFPLPVPPSPEQIELDTFLKALSVAQGLNHLVPACDFSVMRDPRTRSIVIAIRHLQSGELIDLCSPDEVLEMVSHLPSRWRGNEE